MKAAILEMSAPGDAIEFKTQCRARKFDIVADIINRNPSLDDIAGFFQTSPDWIFFSGHLYDEYLTLANDPRVGSADSPTIEIRFGNRGVAINGISRLVTKSTGKFKMHKNCKLTLWTGCEALVTQEFLDYTQELFGPHLLLGYSKKVVWETNVRMVKKFFAKLSGYDEAAIRDAWIGAGKQFKVAAGALDSSGKKWTS